MRTILTIGLVSVLAGCAAMSPEECEFADWDALGELDARQGRAFDYLAQRGKACHKAGFTPDATSYRVGWDRGIGHFCQPEQGFREGLAGRAYGRICPTALEPPFLDGYDVGHEIYRARVARDGEDSAIAELETALADVEDLSDSEIRRLERELDRRRDNVRRLERELGALEGRAAALGFRP